MLKKMFPWILVACCVGGNIYLRTYSWTLPQFGIVAESEINSRVMAALRKAVHEAHPNIEPSLESKITAELFKENLKKERRGLARDIGRRSQELKDRFRDERGDAYLAGIDSYYWLRLLQNLIAKGHIGDRSVGGVEYDDLIGNPMDSSLRRSAHLWLGLIFYKVAAFFKADVPLERPLFCVPLFLSALVGFLSCWTARRLGAGDFGAAAASFIISFSPIFITRSTAEWFDTDIYSIFFPLLAFGIFLRAFEERRNIGCFMWAAFSSAGLALYASTWKGWWFIFDIMLLSGMFFVLNQQLSQNETGIRQDVIKRHFVCCAAFFVFTGVFVTALNGAASWGDFIREPLHLAAALDVKTKGGWPNVFQTVAELGPINTSDMMELLGGYFVFFLALGTLLYLFLMERAGRSDKFGFGILCLILWIIAMFYAGLAASRFVLLLVVPVGLAFGLGIDLIYRRLVSATGRLQAPKTALAVRAAAVCLFSLFFTSVIWRTHLKLAASAAPAMDDYWHDVLVKIKNETPEDAVINTWWDFGHWIKAVAGRRVFFDGMTQNTPYAYWTARALLVSDEDEAVSILGMIDASGNRAVDMLEREGFSIGGAVETVGEMLRMDRRKAQAYLAERGVSGAAAGPILNSIFPEKLPPAYLIISYDMPIKIGSISFIGNWDFGRFDMWMKRQGLSRADFLAHLIRRCNRTPEEAERLDAEMALVDKKEVARWSSRVFAYALSPASSRRDEKLLFFDNGLVVNEENRHACVASDVPERRGVLQRLIYMSDDGVLKEEPQKEPTLPQSALLIKDGKEGYKGLLLEADFAKSMLSRLYYLAGAGLRHFRLFYKTQDEKGNAIYVYRVQWSRDGLPGGGQEGGGKGSR